MENLLQIEGINYLIKGIVYLSKGVYWFLMLPINLMGINPPAYFLQIMYLFVLSLILYRLTHSTLTTLVIIVLLIAFGAISM